MMMMIRGGRAFCTICRAHGGGQTGRVEKNPVNRSDDAAHRDGRCVRLRFPPAALCRRPRKSPTRSCEMNADDDDDDDVAECDRGGTAQYLKEV